VPVTGGTRALIDALRDLDLAGVDVQDVGLRRPTLDDVFLTLTGHTAAPDDVDEQPPASAGAPTRQGASA
jgi:ABC-2 type transport system ATP-binding protein